MNLEQDEVEAIEAFLGESAETGIYWKTAGAIRKLYDQYKLRETITWHPGNRGRYWPSPRVGQGFPLEGVTVKDHNPYPTVNPYDLDALARQRNGES